MNRSIFGIGMTVMIIGTIATMVTNHYVPGTVLGFGIMLLGIATKEGKA